MSYMDLLKGALVGTRSSRYDTVQVIRWPDDYVVDTVSGSISGEDDWHVIHEGYLSDMPGRNESWKEYVRFFGNDRWQYLLEASDFTGKTMESTMEEMSTDGLIEHIMFLDSLDRENLSIKEIRDTIGARTEGLQKAFTHPGWERFADMLEVRLKLVRDFYDDDFE